MDSDDDQSNSDRFGFGKPHSFELIDIAGPHPVKANGLFDGHQWWFRAQFTTWSIEVGGNAECSQPPIWWHEEVWHDAGVMTFDEAFETIISALAEFTSLKLSPLMPGDPGYDDHLLNAWCDGFISATSVASHFSITVIDVVQMAASKGLREPWTAKVEVQRYLQSLRAE
jgi:hypothetical protein